MASALSTSICVSGCFAGLAVALELSRKDLYLYLRERQLVEATSAKHVPKPPAGPPSGRPAPCGASAKSEKPEDKVAKVELQPVLPSAAPRSQARPAGTGCSAANAIQSKTAPEEVTPQVAAEHEYEEALRYQRKWGNTEYASMQRAWAAAPRIHTKTEDDTVVDFQSCWGKTEHASLQRALVAAPKVKTNEYSATDATFIASYGKTEYASLQRAWGRA